MAPAPSFAELVQQVSGVMIALRAIVVYSLIVLWFAANGHRHYRAPW